MESSALSGDDIALGGQQGPLVGAMGHTARHNVGVAVDCLHVTMKARAHSIRGQYGPLASLRTSLFAALKSLYVLSPADPVERQIRVLALMRKELREVRTSTDELVALRHDVREAVPDEHLAPLSQGRSWEELDQLQRDWHGRLAAAVDAKALTLGLTKADLDPGRRGNPRDTQIVKAGAKHLVTHLEQPHLAGMVVHEWRALSAAAHAYSWDNERTQIDTDKLGGPDVDRADERLLRAADLTASAVDRALCLWLEYATPAR